MNRKNTLPNIAITMGDPAGVGPEICLDLLRHEAIFEQCRPVIYGDLEVLRACAERTGKGAVDENLVLDLRAIDLNAFVPGTVNAATGRAAYAYINHAIDAALTGSIDAVVTGPINKEALHAAGVNVPGHTEIFTERTGAERSCMMQFSDELTCTFVTVHVGYREVPELMTFDRIRDVIELTRDALLRIRGHEPKLVVCGLNPHAGEGGLFGEREEERIIVPAIEWARDRGYRIEGPLPPDTAFIAPRRRETDAVICMYHDQGHIPLKALAFDCAVNVTLGLPIIRTSVDHGTALDIAWQGKANPGSLIHAVLLAVRLGRK